MKWNWILVCVLLCSAVLIAEDVGAVAAPNQLKSVNWASYSGNGQYQAARQGLKLVTNPKDIKVLWRHDQHTGIGKSSSKLPKQLQEQGITPFYGGVSSLIVADELVFVTYFEPTGEKLNKKASNRYFKVPGDQLKSIRQIDAHDVTLALNAETGEEVWRVLEEGKGMNFLSGKRGHYGITPCYADGVVYVFGALGRLYAYDAKSGEKQWESHIGKWHEQAVELKKQALAEEKIADVYSGPKTAGTHFQRRQSGMLVVEGVLIVPNMKGGLIGFDPSNGKQIWTAPGIQSNQATPALWTHGERTYLLCNKTNGNRISGTVTALDPKDGKVLWSLTEGLGPNHSSLVVGQNHVLLNTRGNLNMGQKGPKGDKRLGSGLFACYELTSEGAKQKWKLADESKNWHPIRPDRGANRFVGNIRDGVVVVALGADKQDRTLCTFDLKTGKEISRIKHNLSCITSPYIVEERVFVHRDCAHSGNGAAFRVYSISKKGDLKQLGDVSFQGDLKVQMMTGYLVQMETPYYRGRFYMKSDQGVVAIDAREPAKK